MPKQLRNVYRCFKKVHFILEMSIFGFDFMERVFLCTDCHIYYVYGIGAKNMIFKFKKDSTKISFQDLGELLTPMNGREEHLGLFHMPFPL